MNDKSDFTQGSILKKLVFFMLPVLGALILQAAYGAVDLLVVGRFGSTSGLSAVSTGSQVLNLVTFVIIQFAMGITVLIETMNPCGGAKYAKQEIIEAEAESPEAYIREYAKYPVLETIKNADGDTVVTTGDKNGYLIRYTFTE